MLRVRIQGFEFWSPQSLAVCVTLGKIFNLALRQYLHCKMELMYVLDKIHSKNEKN